MKAAPALLGAAGIFGGIATAIANANGVFLGRGWLVPYLYGASAVLLLIAVSMFIAAENQDSKRPRVVPVRYGSASDGHYGLFVANDGEPAYDVVPTGEAPVGSAKLIFSSDIPRLTREEGERLLKSWIELSPHDSRSGGDLFDQMRRNEVAAIPILLVFRDGHERKYSTECTIERDVRVAGGLAVRFVRSRRLGRFSKLSRQRTKWQTTRPSPYTPAIPQALGSSELHDETLGPRAAQLARDIFRFLEEIGPRPTVDVNYSTMTDADILNAKDPELGAFVMTLRKAYPERFRERVTTMVHELAGEGAIDPELNALVVEQNQDEVSLRTVAEKLLALSTRVPVAAGSQEELEVNVRRELGRLFPNAVREAGPFRTRDLATDEVLERIAATVRASTGTVRRTIERMEGQGKLPWQ